MIGDDTPEGDSEFERRTRALLLQSARRASTPKRGHILPFLTLLTRALMQHRAGLVQRRLLRLPPRLNIRRR